MLEKMQDAVSEYQRIEESTYRKQGQVGEEVKRIKEDTMTEVNSLEGVVSPWLEEQKSNFGKFEGYQTGEWATEMHDVQNWVMTTLDELRDRVQAQFAQHDQQKGAENGFANSLLEKSQKLQSHSA